MDGDRVYVLTENGDLACLLAGDGTVGVAAEHPQGVRRPEHPWLISESPLVDGNRVDRHAGRTRRRHGRARQDDRQDHLDQQGAERSGRLRVAHRGRRAGRPDDHDADRRGRRRRARVGRKADVELPAVANSTANITTPVFSDNKVFYTSAYGTGGALLGLRAEAGEVRAQEIYFTREMENHHGGVVLVNGYLYGYNNSILTCLEFATGKRMWRDRSVGKGSVAYADGHLYILSERQCRGARRGDASRIPGKGSVRDPRPALAKLGATRSSAEAACIFAIRARWPAMTCEP